LRSNAKAMTQVRISMIRNEKKQHRAFDVGGGPDLRQVRDRLT